MTTDVQAAPAGRAMAYGRACDVLEGALRGSMRAEILDAALNSGGPKDALRRLRAGMRSHTFTTGSSTLDLKRIVGALDEQTRREGLHVLQGWDFRQQRFADDNAPTLLLDYCSRTGLCPGGERSGLAVLLDQYFLSVLALFVARAWDEGDPNKNLDRVTAMIQDLQGPGGSGQRFVESSETLLLLAISYFHPDESGYDLLVRRVWSLEDEHRIAVALAGAAVLYSHLGWGFRFMYRRDVSLLRKDNVADYPWLLFSVWTLMREYVRMQEIGFEGPERQKIVEGLLTGLAADPWAFAGKAPPALERFEVEHAEVRDMWGRHREALLGELEAHRPSARTYSPLGFQCNFLSNAFVAMVTTAVTSSVATLPLDALFTRSHPGSPGPVATELYARTLMEFSGASPERLAAGGALLIVYDPYEAASSFNRTLRTLS